MAHATLVQQASPRGVDYVETGRMSATLFRTIYPLAAVPDRRIRIQMRRHYLSNQYYLGLFSVASRDERHVFSFLRRIKGLMSGRDPSFATGLRGQLLRRMLVTTPIYDDAKRWLDTGNFLHIPDNEADVTRIKRHLLRCRPKDEHEVIFDGHDTWPPFSDIYRILDRDLFLTDERTQHEAAAVGELLRAHACDSVLDLGCGDGRIARALSSQGFDVVGVDVDGKAVGRAIAACARRRERPSFLVWPLETIDTALPGVLFSAAIIVYAALPWRRKSEFVAYLTRVGRCLRPGGLLIVDMLPSRRRHGLRTNDLSSRFDLTGHGVRKAVRKRRGLYRQDLERTEFTIETTTHRQRRYSVTRMVLPRRRLTRVIRDAGFRLLPSLGAKLDEVAVRYRRVVVAARRRSAGTSFGRRGMLE